MSTGPAAAMAPRWWRLGVTSAVGLVVALVMAAAVFDGYVRHPGPATVVGATLDLVGVGAILARRHLPGTVLGAELVICVATAAPSMATIHGGSVVLTVIALYNFGTRRPPSHTVSAAAVATVAVGIAESLSNGDLGPILPDITLFTAVTAVSFYVRSHRALMASYRERAEQAEHEQQWVATRAVAAERVRIARELHDVVAHHVSLLVVQAGAVRETLPARHVTRPVLDSMIDGGRQAMGELRAMLDALRLDEAGPATAGPDAGGPRDPQPTAEQIPGLVAGARSAGLPVTLRVEGGGRPTPPATSLAAYRIVQEALTNAVRHAPGAFTTVHLGFGADELLVRVRNGPSPLPPAGAERAGPGHGLVGMQERAALADGSVAVGPTDDGWEVRAHLPLAPTARTEAILIRPAATPT